MRIYVPFTNVARLVILPNGMPKCELIPDVIEWFADHSIPHNWMDNPEWWFFDFTDLDLALRFKLTWGGK